jgi:hypothetical protein
VGQADHERGRGCHKPTQPPARSRRNDRQGRASALVERIFQSLPTPMQLLGRHLAQAIPGHIRDLVGQFLHLVAAHPVPPAGLADGAKPRRAFSVWSRTVARSIATMALAR